MIKTKVTAEELKAALRSNENLFNMSYIAQKMKCGTTMCIAGFTLSLAGYELSKEKDETGRIFFKTGQKQNMEVARRVLGQKNLNLFYDNRWTEDLRDSYWKAKTRSERVLVACQVIDFYMNV